MADPAASAGAAPDASSRRPLPSRPVRLLGRITPGRLILAAAVVLTLLALALFAVLAEMQRRDRLDEARERTQVLALLLAEHAGRLLDAADLALGQIMRLVEGRSWDEVAANIDHHTALRRLADASDYLQALALVDQTGLVRVTSRAFPAPPVDTSDREHFRVQREEDRGPFLGRLLRSRGSGETSIVLSRRLETPDGAFRGIAQAAIAPDYFFRFYGSLELEPGTEITLFRDDLAVVLRYPELPDALALALAKWPDPRPLDDGRGRGTLTGTSAADGVERLESFHRVAGFPVHVSVGLARDGITAAWRRTILGQGVPAAAALATVLVLSGVAFQRARREERAQAALEDRVRERTAALQAALQARDLLLKEVNHRVKNNLQLVSSVLNLESRQATSEETRARLAEAQSKVLAIADLHKRLYQSARFASIELAAYLEHLCRDLEASLGAESRGWIALDAEAVELPTDQVVPLALVVTELVTNARKHAWPEAPPGRLEIRLRRTATGIRLEVRDEGAGGAGADAGTGFGSVLVAALVRQLHGTLERRSTARGTHLVLDVPLPAGRPA
jgi:two-component sensor histidine kinase